MARLRPLRALRYNTAHVGFGSVLAPPYDVISPAQQEELYGRDMRNVVRIDFAKPHDDDVPGTDDRYTRARGHLDAWRNLGILMQEKQPALYVTDHEFLGEDGRRHVRRGIFGRVPAKPWDESEVLPHERTMRGPKEDRMALMRATGMQTSAVWVLWDHAPGIAEALAGATGRQPDAMGETPGELDGELLRMWAVTDPRHIAAIDEALAPAKLYIADGHHRFETAAAYAAERRAADPGAPEDADFAMTLVYACAADDPVVEVWPTHRLVRPDAGADMPHTRAGLRARLGVDWSLDPAGDLATAAARARELRDTHHAFGVAAEDGAAVLSIPRAHELSPSAGLDVSVLADRVLHDQLGVTPDQLTGGALFYTREVAEVELAVAAGSAALGFTMNPTATGEIIAVSDAGEVMPQKSTYFYPKVPTGLLLSPL